ncbi:MAG: UrcA family protein [Pseudomonadota bacterium]
MAITNSRIAACLASAILTFGMTTSVDAQDMAIAYDPADLVTEAATLELHRRIAIKARQACRHPSPTVQRYAKGCRTDLRRQIVMQIADPRLMAMEDMPTGFELARAD